jgi:hypothetical protein
MRGFTNLPTDVAEMIYRKSVKLRNETVADGVRRFVENIATEVRESPSVSKLEHTIGHYAVKVLSSQTDSCKSVYENNSTTTTIKRKCIFTVGGRCFMLEHCSQLTGDELFEGFCVCPIISKENTRCDYHREDESGFIVQKVQSAVSSSYGFDNYAAVLRGKIRKISPGEFKLIKEPKHLRKKHRQQMSHILVSFYT